MSSSRSLGRSREARVRATGGTTIQPLLLADGRVAARDVDVPNTVSLEPSASAECRSEAIFPVANGSLARAASPRQPWRGDSNSAQPPELTRSDDERATLEAMARRPTSGQALALLTLVVLAGSGPA